MIIQTSTCDFLVEESLKKDGSVFIYSDALQELQRMFGSSVVEISSRTDWKYQVSICKQDLANTLILLVKEINYEDFTGARFPQGQSSISVALKVG